ncbi:hypothetical protein HK405_004579, partial [Cladochytrium tenue]
MLVAANTARRGAKAAAAAPPAADLRLMVAQLFDTHAATTASRRRGLIELRRLHAAAASASGSAVLAAFHDAVWACLLHIVKARRGAAVDKCELKFFEALDACPAIINHIGAENDDEAIKALGSKLMDSFLPRLARGFAAKSPTVRFRSCQLVALLLNYVTELDDDLHQALREALLQRINDKDAVVRLHAGLALSRFQGPPDDKDEEIFAVLLNMMEGDPSAEVRKSLLWNLDICEASLNALLIRCRDCDPSVRKMLYQ